MEEQREAMRLAVQHVKEDGQIVYATQSVLPLENELQVAHFIEEHGLKVIGNPLKLFPTEGQMDGGFAVVLQKDV